MLSAEHLETALRERLGATHVEVEDQSGGCGESYSVVVVSAQFQGKNKLMRHRLVNGALKDEIAQIHAFTQQSFTPEEFASR